MGSGRVSAGHVALPPGGGSAQPPCRQVSASEWLCPCPSTKTKAGLPTGPYSWASAPSTIRGRPCPWGAITHGHFWASAGAGNQLWGWEGFQSTVFARTAGLQAGLMGQRRGDGVPSQSQPQEQSPRPLLSWLLRSWREEQTKARPAASSTPFHPGTSWPHSFLPFIMHFNRVRPRWMIPPPHPVPREGQVCPPAGTPAGCREEASHGGLKAARPSPDLGLWVLGGSLNPNPILQTGALGLLGDIAVEAVRRGQEELCPSLELPRPSWGSGAAAGPSRTCPLLLASGKRGLEQGSHVCRPALPLLRYRKRFRKFQGQSPSWGSIHKLALKFKCGA